MDELINNFGKLNFTPEAKNELDSILNSFNNISINQDFPKSPKIIPIKTDNNDKIDIELDLEKIQQNQIQESQTKKNFLKLSQSLARKNSFEPLRFNYAVYKEIHKLLSYYRDNDYKIQRVFKNNDIVEIEFGRLNYPNQFMTLSLDSLILPI